MFWRKNVFFEEILGLQAEYNKQKMKQDKSMRFD